MAGHSKFKNIMHRKGAQDKKRSAMFSKLSREITVAAKMGMPDPDMNPRLRLAVNAAKAQSMPKDNIQRAIDKASKGDGENYEEVRYEGYGPGGVAVMVDCMTDNATRTVADVRAAFSRNGGNLGTSGSVAFQFTRTGEIIFDIRDNAALEDRIMEVALDSGADDVLSEDGFVDVLTTPDAYLAVKGALEAAGLAPIDSDVVMRPATRTALDGEAAAQMAKLIARLEELDDVQDVHHNAELPA